MRSFSEQHQRWQAQLEIHDTKTGETALSPEASLHSVELDLEDEKNPRINVTVKLDNKVVKHILFRPSHVVLRPALPGKTESLQIDSVNTATTLRLRPAST